MPDLSGYIEVADRIRDFMDRYPEGSLQCKSVEYRLLPMDGGKQVEHIVYHALAYRTPDDKRPGHGMASEPLPGLTNFTRGSELMNAETSAWGRALAALGFVSKRDGSVGVASANEVRNRPGRTSEGITPSEKQVQFLEKLVKTKKVTVAQLNFMLIEVGAKDVQVEPGWTGKLTGGKEGTASALIDWLQGRPLPDTDRPSDVPAPSLDDFQHPQASLEGTPFAVGS